MAGTRFMMLKTPPHRPPESTKVVRMATATLPHWPWTRHTTGEDTPLPYPLMDRINTYIERRKQEDPIEFKKRTLTNLYNDHPTRLDLAHKRLDEAVFLAYGWNPSLSVSEVLERLLVLNMERKPVKNTQKDKEAS